MSSERYTDFCALFTIAEQKLKEIEQIVGELAIPAVNELRYAGSHCAKSLSTSDESCVVKEIQAAEENCKRAIYESMEIGIEYFLEGLKVFRNDYRNVQITAVMPDYIDDMCKVKEAQEFIAGSSPHHPEYGYDTSQKHFQILKDIFYKCETARLELNKGLRNWRIVLIGLLVAILSLGATIVALYATR